METNIIDRLVYRQENKLCKKKKNKETRSKHKYVLLCVDAADAVVLFSIFFNRKEILKINLL